MILNKFNSKMNYDATIYLLEVLGIEIEIDILYDAFKPIVKRFINISNKECKELFKNTITNGCIFLVGKLKEYKILT